jgi:hypothetical protein
MKQITKYEADDGTMFDTAEAAKAYEDTIALKALLLLDEATLSNALRRAPGFEHIADALERAGTRVAKLRRGSGELKRERRAKGDEPPPASPQEETKIANAAPAGDEYPL